MESKVEQWFSSQLGWGQEWWLPNPSLFPRQSHGRLAALLCPEDTISDSFAEGPRQPLSGLLGLSWQPVAQFPAPQLLRSRPGTKALTNLLLIAWTAACFDLVSGSSLCLLERLYCCKKAFLNLLFRGIMHWKGKVYILYGEEGHWSLAFWHLLIY